MFVAGVYLRPAFPLGPARAQMSRNPGSHATPFLEERDTLVCSAATADRHPLRRPTDILDRTLLATETRSRDWADWLLAAGLPRPTGRRLVFDHFFVTVQAATDGLGLAIGPRPVLDTMLLARRLIAPFPEIVVSRPGYVALVPFDVDKTPSLTAFVAWLVAEGAALAQPPDQATRAARTPASG